MVGIFYIDMNTFYQAWMGIYLNVDCAKGTWGAINFPASYILTGLQFRSGSPFSPWFHWVNHRHLFPLLVVWGATCDAVPANKTLGEICWIVSKKYFIATNQRFIGNKESFCPFDFVVHTNNTHNCVNSPRPRRERDWGSVSRSTAEPKDGKNLSYNHNIVESLN